MTSALELIDAYDGVLLDAYGVLVNSAEALPGARELLDTLRQRQVPHFVVTNDASRLPATIAERLAGLGLGAVDPDHIITSGSLLAPYFSDHQLAGARCFVLGPQDAKTYVREAGGVVVDIACDADCDVVAVCDEAGYEFLATVEDTLSALFRQLDAGAQVRLVMPNPDLIYPKPGGAFGFTSGGAVLLLEAGLDRRYPTRKLRFDRLGKPFPHMFEDAKRRAGSDNLLMVGDQLETDIAGARAANLDAALLNTGVTKWDEAGAGERPTHVIDRLV